MDNFIVSARKYRPATFVSVIGQSHITSTLKNAISRSQLAHAYLFCGPRGVGKTTCARIFAKAINCLNPKDAEACNECESCLSFNEGRSFNIHELDAASNNSVDDIRNLTDQVRIPPQVGRYSVYIIDEVHMLSLQAFNAFLKTLEEPPAHAVFILATTEKHKIIPTILSRCQIYDFNRIRVEDSVSYLKCIAQQEHVTYDEESLHIIAQKADGGMRDALSMFDKVVSFCGAQLTINTVAETLNVLDYDTYFRVTEQIMAGAYTEALLLFDEVLRKGFSGQTFIEGLNAHFRDLLMCKNPQTLPLLEVTGSVAERYKTQAVQCSVPLLFEGINLLTAVDSGFRTSTNQRLHVELGLMKLCGLGQKKNDDTLTGELSAYPQPLALPELVVRGNVPAPTASVAPTIPVTPAASAVSTAQTAPSVEVTSPSAPPATQLSAFSLSGRSIGSILNPPTPPVVELSASEEDETDLPMSDELETDQEAQQLLEKACAQFAQELMQSRPRMGVLFQEVEVIDHRVQLSVPNDSSYDEVMRALPEIHKRVMELSALRTPVEFVVTIAAPTQGLVPIKAEDRLRHLTELNPLINKLRQELELEPE